MGRGVYCPRRAATNGVNLAAFAAARLNPRVREREHIATFLSLPHRAADIGAMRFIRLPLPAPAPLTRRIVLVALAAGLFVVVGRSLTPADTEAAVKPEVVPPTPSVEPELLRQLCELTGQEFRILVHASRVGPRYTVISPDGVVVARSLSEEQIARDFPALELGTMTAEAPTEFDTGADWR